MFKILLILVFIVLLLFVSAGLFASGKAISLLERLPKGIQFILNALTNALSSGVKILISILTVVLLVWLSFALYKQMNEENEERLIDVFHAGGSLICGSVYVNKAEYRLLMKTKVFVKLASTHQDKQILLKSCALKT